MNRQNKILVAILALIFVLYIGYYLYPKSITVESTPYYTKDWNIKVSCQPGVLDTLNYGLQKEHGFYNSYCTVKDAYVYFNVDFNYPNGRRYFTITVKNSSDKTAYYNTKTGSIKKMEKLCYDGQNSEKDGYLNESKDCSYSTSFNVSNISLKAIKNYNGKIIDIKDKNAYRFYKDPYNLKILPGEELYFIVDVNWPENLVPTNNFFAYYQTKMLILLNQSCGCD